MGPYDYRGRSSILFGKEGRRKRMARSDSGHFPPRRAAGSSGRTHWTTTTAPAAANDCSFGVSSFFNAFMMLAAPAHDGLARWDPMGEGEGGHDGIDCRGLTWMNSVTTVHSSSLFRSLSASPHLSGRPCLFCPGRPARIWRCIASDESGHEATWHLFRPRPRTAALDAGHLGTWAWMPSPVSQCESVPAHVRRYVGARATQTTQT